MVTWLVLLSVSAAAAEPRDVTFTAKWDGTEQKYVEILPEGFDPAAAHSVLIALHGHGSDRWQFVKDGRDECRAAREAAAGQRMIFISPDYRAKTSWMGPAAEADLVQILADLRKAYRVDKVVVSGGSMGGTAALTFAALHPDLVDGVVAMNGTANLVEYEQFLDAIAASYGGTKQEKPEEYRKRSAELHAEQLRMPIAVTTGGKDRLVPPDSVLRLAAALEKEERPIRSIHRPAGGHDTNFADAQEAFEFVFARIAAPPTATNVWTKVAPPLPGQRWDVPLGAVPAGPLLVLGGRTSSGEYKKPRPYDVLAWNSAAREWENQFPPGKDWGPRAGLAQAPGWKDERFHFRDAEGNVRPNWSVYGTFSLGQKYDYDPETRKFYFYALGRTFSYDPAERGWADLNPPTDPEKELGGILLWSSMCYDAHNRRFVLFGGGNVQTERGDPGTWVYSPADNTWTQLKLDRQPPPRANSRLAYDPIAKQILLFGGDQLQQLVADTWTFDVVANRWEQRQPALSPSPRAGHALIWLPQAQRLALLGGYGYTSTTGYCESLYRPLPMEAWLWDARAQAWQLVRKWNAQESPRVPANFFLSAAVQAGGGHDWVTVLADGTWQCDLEAKPDAEGTAKQGVPPGATERRTGSYDPAWYREGLPPADPERVTAELRELPTNRWVIRPTPKRPGMNMDWGSAILAPELDLIVRFSGGHSAYSGTAPQVYDLKTDRYSLPLAPELPLEFVYSNDQVHGEWSFGGNPWMTGHTYKATGYDARLRSLVFAPHEFTYFFDPQAARWTRGTQRNPYRADFYNVTLCSTPNGVVAWGDKRDGGGAGLWQLDATTRLWKPLPLTGGLPAKSPDQHGLAYDAKRERLLFFSGADKARGDVVAYDFATGAARSLSPAGKQAAGVASRETVYLPEADAVLLGARAVVNDQLYWLLYDCQRNAWRGIELAGDDPIGKGTAGRSFNNSMGLMYDPTRKLVWAVGQYSHVHALRLDAAAARPLAGAETP